MKPFCVSQHLINQSIIIIYTVIMLVVLKKIPKRLQAMF